ncbi:hypothetical protein N656DRAFT_753862 [Canariomyces notabilis]|uniref:Bul1 C-terminal domain-containing protein n=1 Tax=Canariomyces notabilis TaxID=2074819 RepID=A0AAN6TCZ3_9PEZI|nr:hypothetical protein N656DRAFT_753862 [Canariomyces arenarius]
MKNTSPGTYPRSDIRVNLKDHYGSKVFTSGSSVVGEVTITTRRNVPFDAIQIVLVGHTKTSFDGWGLPQEVTHTFLKMAMPIEEPVPRVLESGHTYVFPFNFTIPSQLTINACNHARLSDQLQDHHLALPPSVGGWERDDMGPLMVRAEYIIKARVLKDEPDGKKTRIMEATQPIQVLPATAEEPPLNVTDNDHLYAMSKTKTLRRHIISTKLGRLTAEAVQPGAAVLSSDGRRVVSHPTAHIKLDFEPESSSSSSSSHTPTPPQITGVTGKITAHTFFSSGPISDFPNLGEWNQPCAIDKRGQYFASTPLPGISFSQQPAWSTHTLSTATATTTPENIPIVRRDSGYCGSSTSDLGESDTERKKKKQQKKHSRKPSSSSTTTTSSSVPISLPTDKKTFLPTFHSCIASRVYTLQLSLAVTVRGSTNNLTLSLPLQVAVEGGATMTPGQEGGGITNAAAAGGDLDGLPSFEEAAADEHLRPRVLHVPGEDDMARGFVSGGSRTVLSAVTAAAAGGRDELPGYAELGYRRAD